MLYLDSTALLATLIDGPARRSMLDAVDAEIASATCAITIGECLSAIDRVTDEPELRADLEDGIRRLWDHLHVVPVDHQLIEGAARLAREQPVRLAHALHLAAAARLPQPSRFATLDPAQIPVALSLGFEVVSP